MVHLAGSGSVGEKDLEGFQIVAPGRYHAIVQAVDDSFQTSASSLIVDFQILAGTNACEKGKTHREYIAVSESAVKRPVKFALAVDLITPAQLGQDLDVDFVAAFGRQLVIDIEAHSYEKEKDDGSKQTIETSRIAFLGFHRLGSADAEGVPLDPAGLQLLSGGAAATPPAAGNGSGAAPVAQVAAAVAQPVAQPAPAPTPQQAPQQAPAANDWSNI